ncbi:MAG TPA: hypothetical protein DD665_10565 [Alphaproteobacteria bacterium]|nr:hypothetical protein [Alphaproteobacteria bacterium]
MITHFQSNQNIRPRTLIHLAARPLLAGWIVLGSAMAPAMAEVLWTDILQDPDNIELNERFVTERLATGDLPAALSAVERVIYLNPADIGLRLLRAEILVNLSNDTLARGELDALTKLPLSNNQQEIVERLIAVIDSRARQWRTTVSTSLGVQGSDNANTYPSSGLIDFMLNPTNEASRGTRDYQSYGGATKSTREVAMVASLTASTTYERPSQDREQISFGVSHASSKGRKYEYLTNHATTIFTNAALRVNGYVMRPQLRVTHTEAKTSADSTVSTASIAFGKSLSDRVSVFGGAEYSNVDQHATSKFATANQNDGHSASYRIGVSGTVFSRINLFAEGRIATFNPMETRFVADTTAHRMSVANKNKAETATAGFAIPLSDWGRLNASIAGTNTKYPNTEVTSQMIRRDSRQRTRVGMQVNGTLLSPHLSAMTIDFSGSITRNDSNIRQYDYKRSDASLLVNYRLAD